MIRFIPVCIILLCGCSEPTPPASEPAQKEDPVMDSALSDINALMEESGRYLQDRDLDGDGRSDQILFGFSGGAHCCYQMALVLSSSADTLEFPFEMDGGYEFGTVDGSQPDQFRIADLDHDGVEEIIMRIATYNGEELPLEASWKEKYGITSHTVVFDYRDGGLVVEDFQTNP